MGNALHDLKVTLRSALRAHAQTISAAERAAASAQLCERLAAEKCFQRARGILFFAPLTDEPDIWPLLKKTLAGGCEIALPRFNRAQNSYAAVAVRDLAADIVVGQFAVREPAAHCPVVPWNRLDLLLVPGLGFDARGTRLGRGKGFYDRLLPLANGVKCGLAFDWQMLAEIPAAPHDVTLNCILTPTRRWSSDARI
jgi:5-formyltetrahydrofolate cyclo-ligase